MHASAKNIKLQRKTGYHPTFAKLPNLLIPPTIGLNPEKSPMTINRRTAFKTLGALAFAASLPVPNQAYGADAWPTRPITYVVPFTPGGSTDVIARTVAQKLSEALGQPVVVENKPGAAGAIGAAYVAKAKADGYTLFGGTELTALMKREIPRWAALVKKSSAAP